ncbi:MAG: hypothetical protein V2B19_22465 [Pseudomonadota bacterium]
MTKRPVFPMVFYILQNLREGGEMYSPDEHIKKTVGHLKKRNPLEKLKELNAALKKLGCQPEPESASTQYRKIVGPRALIEIKSASYRERDKIDTLALEKISDDESLDI